MSVTASLLSGYNTIGERWIEEKYKEQRIRKIKSIGRYTVWKFTSYSIFVTKAESWRTSSFGEHSLPVLGLLRSHKQRHAPLYRNEVFARKEEQKEIGQLEHNKVRRLHQLYVSFMRRI